MMLPSIVMSLGVILIGQSPTGPTCPVTIPDVTQPTEAGPPRQIAPGLNHTLSLAE